MQAKLESIKTSIMGIVISIQPQYWIENDNTKDIVFLHINKKMDLAFYGQIFFLKIV